MGLWTSTGLNNASWEIGRAGSRAAWRHGRPFSREWPEVIKTDVAWVGRGYRFGLDAVKPPGLTLAFSGFRGLLSLGRNLCRCC